MASLEPESPLPPAPRDNLDTVALLESFAPALDGLTPWAADRTPSMAAEVAHRGRTVRIEPASCLPEYEALTLTTAHDLASSSRDLLQPLAFDPSSGVGSAPSGMVRVVTRAFEDPAVAAAIADALRGSDCEGFTTTWFEGGQVDERGTSTVSRVVRDGWGGDSFRIDLSDLASVVTGDDGRVLHEARTDQETVFVHVEGAFAIAVRLVGVAEPDVTASRIIGAFREHVGAATAGEG